MMAGSLWCLWTFFQSNEIPRYPRSKQLRHGSSQHPGASAMLNISVTTSTSRMCHSGVIKCPHFSHHPTIRYMVYNGYYKVMSNIPKMGHLPTPIISGNFLQFVASWIWFSVRLKIAKIVPGTLGFECGPSPLADPILKTRAYRLGSMNDIFWYIYILYTYYTYFNIWEGIAGIFRNWGFNFHLNMKTSMSLMALPRSSPLLL